MPAEFCKVLNDRCVKAKELIGRRKKHVLAAATVPDEWMVDDSDMILPSSYLNVAKAKALYDNSVKFGSIQIRH